MHNHISDSLPTASFILFRTLLLYGALFIGAFIFEYLSGNPFPWWVTPINLIFAAAWALILDYGRMLVAPSSKNAIFKVLFVLPAVFSLAFMVLRYYRFQRLSEHDDLWNYLNLGISILQIGLLVLGVKFLRSTYTNWTSHSNIDSREQERALSPSDSLQVVNNISNLLGQGNNYIDRVIHSVLGRSAKSERIASFSLTVMLTLVLIGGMASFGLWAFTHADRISTLEAERNRLIILGNNIETFQNTLGQDNEATKAQLGKLTKFIADNYSSTPSYEATLSRLSQQSQSNYADIAIRVTIAILTIFLVQVFFSVYKYNRHLAIMLASKAEALELVGNNEAARKELSLVAVNIVRESIPGFGVSPRSVIDEAVRIAEGVKKT